MGQNYFIAIDPQHESAYKILQRKLQKTQKIPSAEIIFISIKKKSILPFCN